MVPTWTCQIRPIGETIFASPVCHDFFWIKDGELRWFSQSNQEFKKQRVFMVPDFCRFKIDLPSNTVKECADFDKIRLWLPRGMGKLLERKNGFWGTICWFWLAFRAGASDRLSIQTVSAVFLIVVPAWTSNIRPVTQKTTISAVAFSIALFIFRRFILLFCRRNGISQSFYPQKRQWK